MGFSVRTDLAIEIREMYQKAKQIDDEVPGVETIVDRSDEDILITKVKITSEEGEKALGKKMGNYITLEVPKLKEEEEEINQRISKKITQIVRELAKIEEEKTTLIVGLGNWNVTADALGPKVINHLEVTRHLITYVPEYIQPGTKSICGIAPGVLGTTGIETGEIIKGIVDKIKPSCVIVIDALASRRMGRISTTVQIADTGIVPGSGVNNSRNALTQETLGVPVIAIGVPTVVDAATIANDTLELVMDNMKKEVKENSDLYKLIGNLAEEDKYNLIKEVLTPTDYNFVVTPKEIDRVIDNVSSVIAEGLNLLAKE